jgi:hypothetical protein
VAAVPYPDKVKKKMIMRSFTSLVRPEIKGINPPKRETNANFRLIKLILL